MNEFDKLPMLDFIAGFPVFNGEAILVGVRSFPDAITGLIKLLNKGDEMPFTLYPAKSMVGDQPTYNFLITNRGNQFFENGIPYNAIILILQTGKGVQGVLV